MKTALIRPFANYISKQIKRDSKNALKDQQRLQKSLVKAARSTQFGRDHDFKNIKTYEDFKTKIPIRDYEGLKGYFEKIKEGAKDVLWPGKPKYFAKTSGTTSGVKYIPVSSASVPNHINSARNALFNYISGNKTSQIFDGKVIFLSGAPTLSDTGGVKTGRLSGIVNHEVPSWLRSNQLPSYETNCIEDWEEKVDAIVEETYDQDLRIISGIPPWVLMYFEKLLLKTGKNYIKDIFPNFSVFAYGGVSFEPYRTSINEIIGKEVDMIETYPASEGFIAYSTELNHASLLLNTNSGIFYEFVKADTIFDENPIRVNLSGVEKDIDYALIINNNAGLWGYSIGDLIRFVSLDPYKIIVSGRIKHFISAFGEHVIGKEVEQAIAEVTKALNMKVIDFTVAPEVNPSNGLPYHEWLIEFEETPNELIDVSKSIDQSIRKQNIYYDDLITGGILRSALITPIRKNGFRDMMKAQGKLGGQNKVPRLSNDRKLADLIKNL
ncbi:MAG: GH3 auxin-responsive promoter family protein [Saprospiraceae bacterium]|nr:GH3 auxin-responsive promoter family protein [Saprospiraceae bacterium]